MIDHSTLHIIKTFILVDQVELKATSWWNPGGASQITQKVPSLGWATQMTRAAESIFEWILCN